MTPERMRAIRETMQMPLRPFARWAKRNVTTLRQMEEGTRPIPEQFGLWLTGLEAWVASNPPPAKSR